MANEIYRAAVKLTRESRRLWESLDAADAPWSVVAADKLARSCRELEQLEADRIDEGRRKSE